MVDVLSTVFHGIHCWMSESCSIFWITLKPFLLGIFYAEIRCWCTVKHSISSVTFYLITLNLVSLVWFRVSGWLLLSVVCSSWLLIFCLVSLLVLSVTSHFRTIEVRFGVTHIFKGNYHIHGNREPKLFSDKCITIFFTNTQVYNHTIERAVLCIWNHDSSLNCLCSLSNRTKKYGIYSV